MRYVILVIPVLYFLTSCDPQRVFEEYRFVGNKGWHRDSAMVFSVDLQDTVTTYNMYLNIRNRGDYPNRNLWLSIATHTPDGRLMTDTVEVVLADPGGRWKGSGIGDLFDNQVLYRHKLEFPVSGEYRFFIKQAMHPVRLKGIQDVGMCLKKNSLE